MYYQYVLGQQYPIFIIKNLNGVEIERISLDLCGINGLTINEKTKNIEHQLLNGANIFRRQGSYLEFILDYADYSPGSNSLRINHLRKMFASNLCEITIIPFSDMKHFNFIVNDTTKELTLKQMKNGINAIGNAGIVLSFETKYLQPYIKWPDPNTNMIAGSYKYPLMGYLNTA